jgi:hypothetical protein
MIGKVFGQVFLFVVILSFATFASDRDGSEYESSGKEFDFTLSSDEGEYELDDEELELSLVPEEVKIENPIPALVIKVSEGTTLLELDLGKLFYSVVSGLKDRCIAPLSEFGSDLQECKSNWEDKLNLLGNCAIAIKDAEGDYANTRERIMKLHDDLVLVTNNGFFSKIKLAITDTKQEVCSSILDETIQCLWQARELLEWMMATRESTVGVSTIPEFCDFVARGANVISKVASPTATTTARNICTYFWKITDWYGYYDHAKVVKDPAYRKKVGDMLCDFEQKEIMLRPFDIGE